MSTTDIVKSISVQNLVRQREAVISRIRQAAELLRDAATIAEAANLGMPLVTITKDSGRGYGQNLADARLGTRSDGSVWEHAAAKKADIEKTMRLGIDCAGWQYLMHESGLRSLMDAAARAKWDKAIQDGDVPELTEANIRSTFKMLHDSRGEMFERGVIACFKSLAWCYKTNLPQKFGKRIVVENLISGYHGGRVDQLDDLLRVMHVMDGKPEPDHRSSIGAKLAAAGFTSWTCRRYGELADDYLTIKTFKNGNGHVTFKRPDLVDQMNRIIAKHYPGALPEPK